MKRIILHWTGGSYTPSSLDKEHYHLVIDGHGKVHPGLHPIAANVPPLKEGRYAAHTRRCNSHSIGISICSMAAATEHPLSFGGFPLLELQWTAAVRVIAKLCREYKITITDKTVLTHAEVQPNLGIKQRGKWDITVLPFDMKTTGADAVGDKLRREVRNVDI